MGGCAGKQETQSPGEESPYQQTTKPKRKSSDKNIEQSSNYDIVQIKPRPKFSEGTSPREGSLMVSHA